LHAQLHFGDSSYFDYYNDDSFNDRLDHVHYELLVDNDLLQYKNNAWRLERPIMASANDQSMAQSYGWECQASRIEYTHPKWIHADLTRQEFRKIANPDVNAADQNSNTPLWALAAGPESSSTAAEAVSALLVGPPTLSYSAQVLKRRLFTNLFIPGESFANSLRAILWFTVPAPELSIILLDWSSLLKGGSNPNALSEVALPILSSLVKLDVGQIRRFLFGQVLMSSAIANKNNDSSAWSLLVTVSCDWNSWCSSSFSIANHIVSFLILSIRNATTMHSKFYTKRCKIHVVMRHRPPYCMGVVIVPTCTPN
jgi:hypothetical protein